uniref:Uncharacterized protein n=1 Tax=Myoviridae sp. ctA4D8 TaxID=2823535 RepID=A0A8S5L6M8_9CAUD|nr:MAG TPA: hypothetical protein [Myoviridae sp. ctA4D8]
MNIETPAKNISRGLLFTYVTGFYSKNSFTLILL